MKNYYTILGIHQNASLDEIRSAFKTSAKKYHPDKNLGKEQAAEKIFKEVSEAHDVLSDCWKKREYDRILQRYHRNSIRLKRHWSRSHPADLFDIKKRGEGSSSTSKGTDYLDGGRHVIGIEVKVPLDLIFTGGFHPFHYTDGNMGQKKLLLIPVKCGCADGTKVKVDLSDRNDGREKTIFNITIRNEEHPFFERVGESLETTVRLSLCEFLKLEEVALSGLDGKPITATLPDISMLRKSSTNPACMEGWAMIEGKGMPDEDDNTKRGNVFVRFIID